MADFVRIGKLALRLHYQDLAQGAFLQCLNIDWHAEAWKELTLLYSKNGSIRDTLWAINQLFDHYDDAYHVIEPHPKAITGLVNIVEKFGYTAVSSKLEAMEKDIDHKIRYAKRMKEMVQDIKLWQSKGFDK